MQVSEKWSKVHFDMKMFNGVVENEGFGEDLGGSSFASQMVCNTTIGLANSWNWPLFALYLLYCMFFLYYDDYH